MRYRLLVAVFTVCFAAPQQTLAQTMSVDKLIAFIESSAKIIQEKKMTDNELTHAILGVRT